MVCCWVWSQMEGPRWNEGKLQFQVLDSSSFPVHPAGTKNSFQTLQMKLENITNPWSQDTAWFSQLSSPDAVFSGAPGGLPLRTDFAQIPALLALSRTPGATGRSYRVQIHSMADQVLPRLARGAGCHLGQVRKAQEEGLEAPLCVSVFPCICVCLCFCP